MTRDPLRLRAMPDPEARLDVRGRAGLSLEVLAIYARAWWWLRRRGLQPALAAMRSPLGGPASAPAFASSEGKRLGRAASRIIGFLPTDSRCLMRSLVLTGVLARRGIATRLVIAVRTDPAFAAHAWVELDGEALLAPAGPPFQRLLET